MARMSDNAREAKTSFHVALSVEQATSIGKDGMGALRLGRVAVSDGLQVALNTP
jgi:hypothetical protein